MEGIDSTLATFVFGANGHQSKEPGTKEEDKTRRLWNGHAAISEFKCGDTADAFLRESSHEPFGQLPAPRLLASGVELLQNSPDRGFGGRLPAFRAQLL